ncbi:MAG: hypothetical protein ABFS18_03060, partial [Thermodesulfobacteriota bacterium]
MMTSPIVNMKRETHSPQLDALRLSVAMSFNKEMKIMRSVPKISFIFVLLLCLFGPAVQAMDLTVERQVQTALKQSKALLLKIELKQQSGSTVIEDIKRLKELADALKGDHQQ